MTLAYTLKQIICCQIESGKVIKTSFFKLSRINTFRWFKEKTQFTYGK